MGAAVVRTVDVVTAGCPGRPEPAGLLVRPDGFTRWATGTGPGSGPAGDPGQTLGDAPERWSGAAAPV